MISDANQSVHDSEKIELLCRNATAVKYDAIVNYVWGLRVKDKRLLFSWIRDNPDPALVNEHLFLPRYGITAGEFATGQTLIETVRKTKGKH